MPQAPRRCQLLVTQFEALLAKHKQMLCLICPARGRKWTGRLPTPEARKQPFGDIPIKSEGNPTDRSGGDTWVHCEV